MIRSFDSLIAELHAAVALDRGARNEALQRGMSATQPLTLERLSELCALGDRMLQTAARRRLAAINLNLAMGLEPHSPEPG